MLSVLVLALEVLNADAQPLGMTINWSKTKIQDLSCSGAPCQRVSIQGNEVEVIESVVYLGSVIHCSGGSELEIKWCIAFIHESMFALDQNIRGSGITLETKLRLYNTCILPIFLYGSEIWCLTSTLEKKIDALDNWGLRRILHIHWTDFVSNDVVRSRTGQPLLSDTIRQRCLSFFGHLCHADIGPDHSRALRACIRGPPKRLVTKNWKIETNLAENDLRPLNFSTATARRHAMDRLAWHLLVDAATSS